MKNCFVNEKDREDVLISPNARCLSHQMKKLKSHAQLIRAVCWDVYVCVKQNFLRVSPSKSNGAFRRIKG